MITDPCLVRVQQYGHHTPVRASIGLKGVCAVHTMAAPQGQVYSRLDGFEIEIFKLVKQNATPIHWKEWLRAPLEHAAAEGR